jgi:hypothetical protein
VSDAALDEFEQARKAQLDRNEARRMRALVNQARGDTHGAGARWPFELTQNAHDPGARDGQPGVNITLTFDGQRVLYEHDGRTFTMQDLAALLSGGSSKEFESTETTGRFGTGFLVTHVLSPQIRFTGALATDGGPEEVSILLDRGGDEEDILRNTAHCYDAIKRATELPTLEGRPTAQFEFQTDNGDAARIGIASFRRTIPYLYATCEHLGAVTVRDDAGGWWRFEPEDSVGRDILGLHLRTRQFRLTTDDAPPRLLSAVLLRRVAESRSGVVVVKEQVDGHWQVNVPSEDFPRIFCRFPVRASDFLPINVVVDGRFDLRQERDRVLMKDGDKEQMADALRLLPALVLIGFADKWRGGHRLARVGMPDQAFGEKFAEPDDLRDWWRSALGQVAEAMALLPIVETPSGPLMATGSSPIATFVVPRFLLEEQKNALDFDDVWSVASEVQDLHPPLHEVASDWAAIASDWANLGVKVRRVGLTQIADSARQKITTLGELRVTTDPLRWLARFLNLVGRVADEHNCAPLLSQLIPNQNRTLKSPTALVQDSGISDTLKDIALAVGRDVRDSLLLGDLVKLGDQPDLPYLKPLLDAQITQTIGEGTVVKDCIAELNACLPDNKRIPDARSSHRRASVALLKYLWETRGAAAAAVAQQCPLVSSEDAAIRWSVQRKALAPVSAWHQAARPFAKLYEGDRILSEDYTAPTTTDGTIVNALVSWDMAFSDPLCTDAPRDLRSERLEAMSSDAQDCTDVIVSDVPLSQIALLPNQLIQRCQASEELAKLLLGLTLTHIAVNDRSWREMRRIPARRDRADITLSVRPALWLADLKTKAWVPVRGEKDGQQVVQPVIADAGNLRRMLLDAPQWLLGNDAAVELLSGFFGFNALELRLLCTLPSTEARTQVEGELAKIVQALGGDPAKYGALVEDLAAQQEREAAKKRNRKFGLAVQEAIKTCLDRRGLHLRFIDRGYDYDLFLGDVPAVEAGTHHFQLGDYLLEVKATTTGEIRLTPLQAKTASDELGRFILCVVDLRGLPSDRVQGDWAPEDVEPIARIVVHVGTRVQESHELVQQAKDCEVGIRNELSLRYGVPVGMWEGALSLSEWIEGLPLLANGEGA